MLKTIQVSLALISFWAAPCYAQSPKIHGLAGNAIEIREGPCVSVFEVIKGPHKGKFGYTNSGEVQVLRDVQEGLLSPEAPKDTKIVSIMCVRSTPIPFPLDYRVILSGFELYTVGDGERRDFMAILSKQDGAYVLAMEKGELTDEEKSIVDEMLQQFLNDEKEFLGELEGERER